MTFSNAGHNYPFVACRDGRELLLERGGLVLGVLEASDYEEEALNLQSGDRVVLYTDGITEAVDPSGELFGEDRLHDAIRAAPHDLSARQTADHIFATLQTFQAGEEARDDITLMVLKVLDPDPARLGSGVRELVESDA
jgi:sigma-B regulation protein RsbU (phosphoserine phosphatase)